ncbi:MAG: glycosyltransferase family 2 protein [Fervidobacterium sp.]
MLVAIIPAKNEENNIEPVINKTKKYVDLVLVIDDGSTDATGEVSRRAGATVIRNEKNLGKADALKIGFDYILKTNADLLVMIDGDGQHDPDEIPILLSKIEEGFDIVVGARQFNLKKMPFLRAFSNSFSSWLTTFVCRTPILDSQSGYRVLKRKVIESIKFETKRYQLETEMLVKASRCGFKIGFVGISTIYTLQAKSKINQVIDPIKFLFVLFKLSFFRCKKKK